MKSKSILMMSSCLIMAGMVSSPATAQDAPAAQPDETTVVVIGSQIRGRKVTQILPVTVVDEKDLDVLAPDSGEQVFRALPSQGATNFSGDSETGGINGARGDVASINLRSLGTGNTLVLLNGRRLVLHPGTQAENLVPVVTPNLNALPTAGIRRLEVLRDGASAIYGADAVGGVVNTVLRNKYDGLQITTRFGEYDGVNATGTSVDIYGGTTFNQKKTNLTMFASYYARGGILASERPYSINDDMRPLVAGTVFAGDSGFNNSTTNTAWGQFDTTQRVSRGSTNLTSAAGGFHIQPTNFAGCLQNLSATACIDDGSLDTALRHNNALFGQATSDLERLNTFAYLTHQMDNGATFYAEASYYQADSDKIREGSTPLSSTPITISKTAYYNPFGATTINGVANTQRIAGINAPTTGLDITVGGDAGRYRILDAGPRLLRVDNDSYRFLAGIKGERGKWSYDSAVVYSRAWTRDLSHNRVSNTLFQAALNRTTSDAYNPFNGGDINNPTGLDATPNPQATINSFLIDVVRENSTSLVLADYKVSTNQFATLWGKDIGAAFGVEFRRETYEDDRDDRLDGTIKYTDSVTGLVDNSDVMGSSGTPDTSGKRITLSGFGELQVPLVSPEQGMPFVRSLELQLAGRYERASDFGDVFAPKLAISWEPVSGVQVRTAYSEGFRAPNLDQVNAEGIERSNTRTDWIRCQAQINLGTIASLNACSQNEGVQSLRSGSDELEPETNETGTFGLTFRPSGFLKGFAATLDYYHIKQENVVGIGGDANAIALDYVRRLNGSTNAAVVRAAPDADDINFFAGSGLAAVGSIIRVDDPYVNLDRRTSEGYDIGLYYDLETRSLGDFSFALDATYLKQFSQELSEAQQEIRREARANLINLVGEGSFIEQDGYPRWRGLARITWKKDNLTVGASAQHTGAYLDTSIVQDITGELWPVDSWTVMNLYADYNFKNFDIANAKSMRVRVGANNITNEAPPLIDETFGYDTAYHDNRGRFLYVQLRATF
jgi:outer membrane receptor protein involved in Fe transport